VILYVLDKKYQTLDILDTFTEATWNVFFRDEGNCMVYLPAHKYATNKYLKAGNYLMMKGSDRYMIIEDFETLSEADMDPIYAVEGRSLESILDRRVIWNKISYAQGGSVQGLVRQIVTENLVSPSIGTRAIPGFIFVNSTDSAVTSKVTAGAYELHGENVLETVRTICSRYDLGFKVLPNGNGGFKMSLYAGKDRSRKQDVNPWVVFSPKYENLESTSLTVRNSKGRNAILMYNEHDYTTTSTKTITLYDASGNPYTETISESEEHHVVYSEDVAGTGGTKSGLDRRELFLQSSKSHNKDDGTGTMYTESEYRSIIQQEGKDELSEHDITGAFSGKVEALRQFTIGKDFDLGDIVQVENEYGMTGRCRVAEVIYSHNDSGERVIPYFTNVGSDNLTN